MDFRAIGARVVVENNGQLDVEPRENFHPMLLVISPTVTHLYNPHFVYQNKSDHNSAS